MRKKGCLLTWLILFACMAGVYAFGIFDGDKVQTPDYYDTKVRVMFKKGQWKAGKKLLDEGMKIYPDVTGLNELNGRYYYHYKKYDDARYYLVRSVRDDPHNVMAKQLLVNVEDETGNYSSAICYVNELLEINPYWRGLWRKKIGLYRKQGNDVEADRLLKRLHQIYPNDSVVKHDYAYSLEECYVRHRKSHNRDAAIESLQELIKAVPDKEAYYIDLINLMLQQGNTEGALEVAGRGASRIPGSASLVIKKASILAEESRYQEAMAYVKSRMKYNNSGSLSQLYNSLLTEAAAAAEMNDPYVLYGKLYETSKSNEALDYMLNTSITRGYNEDALYYLAEAKKRRGEQPALLYKEYVVYKRMGNISKAYSLLTTLSAMNPSDGDLADELAHNRMQQAQNLITDGFYSEALPYLKAAVRSSRDPEVKISAMNKIYMCHYEMRRYGDALALLDSLHASFPDDGGYFVKKADVLNKQGDAPAALAVLDSAMRDTAQLEMRESYASAYEEIAVPYIKVLIERGATFKAFDESVRLLAVNPSSREGLQYVIGMSDQLRRYEAYDSYVSKARSIYPEDIDFIVKQAASYSRNGEYRRAIDLMRPWLNEYPDNEGLVGAFSQNSEYMAMSLIKAHRPDSALAVADSALIFDAGNGSLLLAKGTAYEALHRYDSAYVYQRQYKPGIGEVRSFMRHLDGLQSRSFKNEVAVEYLQGRYGEEDVITSVASASYTRKETGNTYTGRVNYAGRDGSAAGEDPEDQVPGGVGLQLQAAWEHKFSSKWTGYASAAYATRYFPKIMAELKAVREFSNDLSLDIHASYRSISTYTKTFRWNDEAEGSWEFDSWDEMSRSLLNVGVGVSKTWDRLVLSGKVDGYMMSSSMYVNASAQLKYFPLDDGRTSITVTGGLGTAPEANMIDYAMPNSFDKLNTMVGLGGTYMLNKHLSLGLMGTWHTFYSQLNNRLGTQDSFTENIETRYKNLFNVYMQLYVHF